MHERLVYFHDSIARTGVDICMKIVDGQAVSATITRLNDQPRDVQKANGQWELPELWQDHSTIAWMLEGIERRESKYAGADHQGR